MNLGLDPRVFQRAFTAALRLDFVTFLAKTVETLSPGKRLMSNWHIEALAFALERVRTGERRRLIINLPPRSLKSIMASVALPAYALGHDPTRRIICASYGTDLARKHANDFRAVVGSSWYQRAFPSTRIDQRKNTETEVATTKRGFRLSVSVGGPLTGRGGDMAIIDDPLKPVDALSESLRDGVNQWFSNTLLSRLDDKRKGAIVIVMQRVHVDDLVGHVTQLSSDWEILSLPAIADTGQAVHLGNGRLYNRGAGEALHPEREPIAVLEKIRRELGSDNFAAQYQQTPLPPEGAMIKRHWVGRYTTLPPASSRIRIIQSWDTANKGGAENDWSVCTTWRIQDGRLYLIHLERGRYDYPDLKAKVVALAKQFSPSRILIEDAGTGTALIQEIKKEQHLPAIAVRPDKDKVARMSIQSGKFEANLVYLPKEAPWLAPLEAELFAFPNVKYDDQVDSISQFLANYKGGYDSTLSWVR